MIAIELNQLELAFDQFAPALRSRRIAAVTGTEIRGISSERLRLVGAEQLRATRIDLDDLLHVPGRDVRRNLAAAAQRCGGSDIVERGAVAGLPGEIGDDLCLANLPSIFGLDRGVEEQKRSHRLSFAHELARDLEGGHAAIGPAHEMIGAMRL